MHDVWMISITAPNGTTAPNWTSTAAPGGTSTDGSTAWLSIGAAVIAGIISAVSINILAYAAHLERQNSHRQFGKWALPVNLVMSVVAQSVFFVATNTGPVAVAMPVQTAAQLMMNMMIQVALQMKEFTKAMRVGTMTICCAILCLIDVGPTDQPLTSADMLERLKSKVSLVFLVSNTLITVIGCVIIWGKPTSKRSNYNSSWAEQSRREIATTTSSLVTMAGYSAAQASTIVLTTSLSKVIGHFTGIWRIGFGMMWLGISLFNVVVASMAAKRCDASFYVPLYAGSKLVINALAGLSIWQDKKTLTGHLICYSMIYCLIIMGVYLLSSVDVVGMIALRRLRAGAGLDKDFETSSMGEVTQDLVSLWRQEPNCGENTEENANIVVRRFLQEGLDTGTWSDQAMMELSMAMLRGKCSSVDPDFLGWIKWNLQAEPKLVHEMVALKQLGEDDTSSSQRSNVFRSWVDGCMVVAPRRRRGPSDSSDLEGGRSEATLDDSGAPFSALSSRSIGAHPMLRAHSSVEVADVLTR